MAETTQQDPRSRRPADGERTAGDETGLGPGGAAQDGAAPDSAVQAGEVYTEGNEGLVAGQSEQGGWRGAPVGNPSDRDAIDGAPPQDASGNAQPLGQPDTQESTPYRGGDPQWPHGQWHDDERGGGGDWARSGRGNGYRGGPDGKTSSDT